MIESVAKVIVIPVLWFYGCPLDEASIAGAHANISYLALDKKDRPASWITHPPAYKE